MRKIVMEHVIYGEEDREFFRPFKLEFEVNESDTLKEDLQMCKAFLYSLGHNPDNIDNAINDEFLEGFPYDSDKFLEVENDI